MPPRSHRRKPRFRRARNRPRCAALVLILVIAACDRHEPTPPLPAAAEPPIPATSARPADLLTFPVELRVPDESVNAFVERAMAACSTGNYDEFRRLWSAQRDPLPRSEFEQGWQAVKTIRVRALQKIILAQVDESAAESSAPGHVSPGAAEDQVAYVLLTDLSLDPKHPAGQDQPKREAALLIVHEREDWCLTKAPKQVREWVKEHLIAPASTPSGASVKRTGVDAAVREPDVHQSSGRGANSPNP